MLRHSFLVFCTLLLLPLPTRAADKFPPGWLRVSRLDAETTWSAVREDKCRAVKSD